METLLQQSLQELKTLIQVVALPPVPPLALMLLGAGLLRQRRWLGRGLLSLGALSMWLSFTEAGADHLQQLLLGVPPALSAVQIETLKNAPDTAVLVLGAGIYQQAPEYGQPTLKPLTLERLRYGLWLARRTGLPAAFSGGIGRGRKAGDVDEAGVAQRVASQEFGLPLRWTESRSRDTRENASLSPPLLSAAGIKRIVLVTHALHMPRAERAFREAGGGRVELVLAPVGLRSDAPHDFYDWLPTGEGSRKLRYVLYEWLGLRAGK